MSGRDDWEVDYVEYGRACRVLAVALWRITRRYVRRALWSALAVGARCLLLIGLVAGAVLVVEDLLGGRYAAAEFEGALTVASTMVALIFQPSGGFR